ncbi:hypothetical protein KSS93_05330 [Pseudomonas xanthosomatis]|uniref:hypothetical protein n=1 Tax=Pseudomonas xanthosomatis TaxID=2842356 RepID=UPI001C3D4E35|nr:hypothetical protein [Pseudomonas xanthosomatis]QXH47350.1 hypothetical protein KSS93_05330 [Pseudomonas xanthosomatis]
MNTKGMIGALLVAPLLAALGGCVAPGGQQQGFGSTQAANANSPCTPSASDNLISTGRSLLSIANSVLETKQNLSGDSTTYAQRVKAAESAQKVEKGNQMMDQLASLSGSSASPCTAAAGQTSASR